MIKKINQKTNNWPLWRLLLTILNVSAIALSIILSWHYFKGEGMPGCGIGSSCDQVLSSRWSSLAGIIPVSGLALGTYIAMFIASFNTSTSNDIAIKRLSWSIMLTLGGIIIGSAIWFTILQKWIIESFCMYCMTTHAIGFSLSGLIIWRVIKEKDAAKNNKNLLKPTHIIALMLAGILISALVATSQYRFTPNAIEQNSNQQNISSEINYEDAPIIGSPNAPIIITLLFDYQCSHCQKLHFMLKSAVRHYNGKLAFVLFPTPLENNCNPYIPASKTTFKNSCKLAKIGLAVWRANPEAFPEFENWMFTFDSGNAWHPRNIEATMAKAIELVGKEKLNTSLTDPWIEEFLQNSINMFGQTLQNGRGAIPKMIYNNTWVIPEPYNSNDFVTILQKSLGIPMP